VASLVVEGDQLVVRLSTAEHLESLRGDVSVPLSSVRSVEILENAMGAIHGIRFGTGVPGILAVGTFTSPSTRIFGVVHHAERRGVRVTLIDAEFDELVISCRDPEGVAGSLPVPPA